MVSKSRSFFNFNLNQKKSFLLKIIYWNNISYNNKADVWSIGCILAELLTGHILFSSIEPIEQYHLIIRLCGSPNAELILKIVEKNSPKMQLVIERISGAFLRTNFKQYFKKFPINAINLLDLILVLDPDKRLNKK